LRPLRRTTATALLFLVLVGAAPAARNGDTVSAGGSVTGPGAPTVLICGKPAARLGDATLELAPVGPTLARLPGSIVGGSATVLIAGKPAARAGDKTSLGHAVTAGCPTVLIGG